MTGQVSLERKHGYNLSRDSSIVAWAMLFLLYLMTYLVAGSWVGFHAVLLAGVGALMVSNPSELPLPRLGFTGLLIIFILAASAFLPAHFFSHPSWRENLELHGIDTGLLVVMQPRLALESYAVFLFTLLIGSWLLRLRFRDQSLSSISLGFVILVAGYAILSRSVQDSPYFEFLATSKGHLGFFPNRNHTATFLVMGAICGFGCVLQSAREQKVITALMALIGCGVCLWAINFWSVSRAGVILFAVGMVLWISILGLRYLGKHGKWALIVLTILLVGGFTIHPSEVRDRVFENLTAWLGNDTKNTSTQELEKKAYGMSYMISRSMVYKDTFELLNDYPLTGIGVGEFRYVIPQYRSVTSVANGKEILHPESDWLWYACEIGLPATVAVLCIVVISTWKNVRMIRRRNFRALRSACMVAAIIVPIHGLFDVPGHRITLVLLAILLFSMSLPQEDTFKNKTTFPRLWDRSVGFVLLIFAAYLARSEWLDGAESSKGYVQDAKKQNFVITESALLSAISKIEQALKISPLDPVLYRHLAFYSLHFQDRYDTVDKAFSAERALDPTWVDAAFLQAKAYAKLDPAKSILLGNEAIIRAQKVDQISAGSKWSEKETIQRLKQISAKDSAIASWLESLEKNHSEASEKN